MHIGAYQSHLVNKGGCITRSWQQCNRLQNLREGNIFTSEAGSHGPQLMQSKQFFNDIRLQTFFKLVIWFCFNEKFASD